MLANSYSAQLQRSRAGADAVTGGAPESSVLNGPCTMAVICSKLRFAGYWRFRPGLSQSSYVEWSDTVRFIRPSNFVVRPVGLLALGAAVMMAGLPVSSGAQGQHGAVDGAPTMTDSAVAERVDWSFGAWLAGGTHQPLKTRVGHVEDRALYILGVSASRPLWRWHFGELRFAPTLLPAIVATANREYRRVGMPSTDGPGHPQGYRIIPYKKSAFGVGLLPIAVEGTVFASASGKVGLVIGGGGGGSYFNRRIPDPGETRFNFLADGHTGIYLRSGIGVTTVGFRLQHISNGDTGQVNPGMDSRMLYMEFSR
jgi:hypothetical protein